jgi:phosphocarrier protein HPr
VAVEREVVVLNKEGLHFRPIMQFVDTRARFQSQVTVHHDGRRADGSSPMDLLMLVATCGAKLKLVAEGDDAQEALDALARLFEAGFGETM